MKIQMVDLQGQYLKIRKEVEEAVSQVFERAAFIQGPEVKKFESDLLEYNKAKFSISCANGTDALQIAMMALNLKPGDEIIIPAFTYIATVEAAALLGLKTVLVDVDPNTFNISAENIKKAITPATKAIVPVHLYGQCADMENIISIAETHNLYIIEDTAQAMGAIYKFKNGLSKFAGTIGTIGTTSFFPSKNLGCYGDGGALFTNDEALAKKIKMIANHGQERKYYHDSIGVNSRLDTLQAAILLIKLKYLNQYAEARQMAASIYDKAFDENPYFTLPYRDPASTHVFHQYTIALKENRREQLKEFLESKGIPSMVYYPIPVHFQKAYENLGYTKGTFPISEMLSSRVLSLPMHTELSEEQLNYITETTLSFFK